MDTTLLAPESNRLLAEVRRNKLVEMVEAQGTVTTEALVSQFGVSLMTIWRDVTMLAEAGRLRKIRGGATLIAPNRDGEPLFVSKQVLNRERKAAIAHYAATTFIHDNDIIFVEAGTTAAAMVKYLHQRNLTVIGNGLGTMNELAKRLTDVHVYCCGGMLRDVAQTFVGPQAEEFFQRVNAHTCFLGATGFTSPEGFTDANPLEIQVKRAMAKQASRVVMLLDSSKLGVKSLTRILPTEEIDIVVTDAAAAPAWCEQMIALGLDVRIAGANK